MYRDDNEDGLSLLWNTEGDSNEIQVVLVEPHSSKQSVAEHGYSNISGSPHWILDF